jgi:hypothetical protein
MMVSICSEVSRGNRFHMRRICNRTKFHFCLTPEPSKCVIVMPKLIVVYVLYLQSLVLERGYNNLEFGDVA